MPDQHALPLALFPPAVCSSLDGARGCTARWRRRGPWPPTCGCAAARRLCGRRCQLTCCCFWPPALEINCITITSWPTCQPVPLLCTVCTPTHTAFPHLPYKPVLPVSRKLASSKGQAQCDPTGPPHAQQPTQLGNGSLQAICFAGRRTPGHHSQREVIPALRAAGAENRVLPPPPLPHAAPLQTQGLPVQPFPEHGRTHARQQQHGPTLPLRLPRVLLAASRRAALQRGPPPRAPQQLRPMRWQQLLTLPQLLPAQQWSLEPASWTRGARGRQEGQRGRLVLPAWRASCLARCLLPAALPPAALFLELGLVPLPLELRFPRILLTLHLQLKAVNQQLVKSCTVHPLP